MMPRVLNIVGERLHEARRILRLLPRSQQRLYLWASGLYAALGLLDIAGIALTGLLAAILASGMSQAHVNEVASGPLQFIGLGGLTRLQTAAVLGVTVVLLLLMKSAAGAYLSRRLFRFLARQQAALAQQLVGRLLTSPLVFVQRWTTPEITYMVTSGTSSAIIAGLGGMSSAVAEVALFAMVAISLLLLNPVLALATGTIFGGVVVYLQIALGRRASRDSSIMQRSSIAMGQSVWDSLSAYREAVVLHRRVYFIREFSRQVHRNALASADMQFTLEIPKYLLEGVLVITVFALAAIQFMTQDLTTAAATVALFLTAGFRLIPSLLRLQAAGTNIRQGIAASAPTVELAEALQTSSDYDETILQSDHEPSILIHRGIRDGFQGFEPTVQLEDVVFSYPNGAHPAVQSVSLIAHPGTSLALVGSTGAGKSTLADLILGVLRPDSGSITISGHPPAAAINAWPGAVSYVPQMVTILEGTIRDNVVFELPIDDVDDERVWHVLEQAHLADYLRRNREGLDTRVGERGVRLSGGQRQRLGIARALYSGPQVLVMDEATSSLDAETEAAITEALQTLAGAVTRITVAHRLATVRDADELLFMRHGRVVARGTFEEVRAQEPDFARQAKLLGL